jgi:hypothetical protein
MTSDLGGQESEGESHWAPLPTFSQVLKSSREGVKASLPPALPVRLGSDFVGSSSSSISECDGEGGSGAAAASARGRLSEMRAGSVQAAFLAAKDRERSELRQEEEKQDAHRQRLQSETPIQVKRSSAPWQHTARPVGDGGIGGGGAGFSPSVLGHGPTHLTSQVLNNLTEICQENI